MDPCMARGVHARRRGEGFVPLKAGAELSLLVPYASVVFLIDRKQCSGEATTNACSLRAELIQFRMPSMLACIAIAAVLKHNFPAARQSCFETATAQP